MFILCLSFNNFVQSSIFVKYGTQTRIRNISIRTVVRTIGQNLCSSLLGMHAYTGCDTLSAKSGRGKISPLRIVKEHKAFQDMFKLLGTDWELSDNLFEKLQEFTCRMYCSRPQTNDINELRYKLFCVRRENIESIQLPPCADCLCMHTLRANYQAAVCKHRLQSRPVIPCPTSHGWNQDGTRVVIQWISWRPAPASVLELLSCSCTRSCALPCCSCLANS